MRDDALATGPPAHVERTRREQDRPLAVGIAALANEPRRFAAAVQLRAQAVIHFAKEVDGVWMLHWAIVW